MGLFDKKVIKDDLVDEEISTKKPIPKWLFGVVAVVAIIAVMIGVKSMTGSKSDGINYYDTITGIFSNELGTFKYVFDIRTGEKGTLLKDEVKTEVDVNNIDNADEPSGEVEEEIDTKYEFSDWGEMQDILSDEWEYPNYKITIEGCTTSLDPLTTEFTIGLATKYYNNVLTDVTCINGNYYINIESFRDWLINSKDSYLIEIGSELPQGSKYLVIPENEFTAVSRYAETGELDFSKVTGLKTMYQRFLVSMISVRDTVKSSLGTTGMTSNGDVATLSLVGNDAVQVMKFAKGVVNKGSDFYQSVIDASKAKGLYDEQQYAQAVREKDNVISAIYDMMVYLNIADLTTMNPQVSGSARQFVSGRGKTTLEGNLLISFCTDDTDYMIQFSGNRSGEAKEIYLPQGSQMSVANMKYPTQLSDVCHDIIDYFNISNIKTAEQLELTPDNIANHAIEEFVALVNSVGTAGRNITLNNVNEFIEEYINFEVTDDTTVEQDANAKLVSDFMQKLNDLTGGLVIEKEIIVQDTTEQYPSIQFSDVPRVDFYIKYATELSDSRLMVLEGIVVNRSDEAYTLDTTDFAVKTLLNSKYPANNEILLKNYDNKFDFSQLTTVFEVEPNTFAEFELYIVLSDDLGHMDIFYKDVQQGTAVQY